MKQISLASAVASRLTGTFKGKEMTVKQIEILKELKEVFDKYDLNINWGYVDDHLDIVASNKYTIIRSFDYNLKSNILEQRIKELEIDRINKDKIEFKNGAVININKELT